jgi:hypothetical protein
MLSNAGWRYSAGGEKIGIKNSRANTKLQFTRKEKSK